VITKRLRVSLGADENTMNLIVVITAQLNLLKTTGLYTSNGQILEYYIFVKLLRVCLCLLCGCECVL